MQATNIDSDNDRKKLRRQARAAFVFLTFVAVFSLVVSQGSPIINSIDSNVALTSESSFTASIMRAYNSFRGWHDDRHSHSDSNSTPTTTTTPTNVPPTVTTSSAGATATPTPPTILPPVTTTTTSGTSTTSVTVSTPVASANPSINIPNTTTTATATSNTTTGAQATSTIGAAAPTALVSTVSAVTTATTTSLKLNYGFGMAVSTTLLGLTPAQLNTELNDLVALHVGWIRMDFDWSVIEPQNNGVYNLSGYKTVINAANAHHINVLGIIDGVPSWASDTDCSGLHGCIPASEAQFAQYAGVLASQLAPYGVVTWEIWNEPNLAGSWNSAADPTQYVQMLQAVYPAIKKANPSAWVITGGLAPATTNSGNIAPTDFLSLMYALGARYYFDAVGDHPYSYPAIPSNTDPWSGWQMMSATTPNLRGIMVANGDSNKKIWATEYGAPTNGPGIQIDVGITKFSGNIFSVTEALQSEMIAQAITFKENNSWMGPLFIYNYKDLGTSQSTSENFFGIIRYDGTDKAAYTVIQQMLAAGL